MLHDEEKMPLIAFDDMDKEIVDPVELMVNDIRNFAERKDVDAETVFAETLALCTYELMRLSFAFDKVDKQNKKEIIKNTTKSILHEFKEIRKEM